MGKLKNCLIKLVVRAVKIVFLYLELYERLIITL